MNAGGTSGWTGAWTAERLGIEVVDAPTEVGGEATAGGPGLRMHDLFGLALRINPRRPHLLVSTVLAKHVPTDPRVVRAAGLLLGLGVATHLRRALPADDLGGLLARAVAPEAGEDDLVALDAAVAAATATVADGDGVVLGYAETATALGHLVARALRLPSLHSTRRHVPGAEPALGFDEAHSHATEHLLLPADPALLATTGPAVLVDDELSTGSTALGTIRALHAVAPRSSYVIAALVDVRREVDRARMQAVAAELGVSIDVVALAAGEVRVPDGVVAPEPVLLPRGGADSIDGTALDVPDAGDAWPVGVRESGRHGFTWTDESPLTTAAGRVAARLVDRLALTGDDRVLVLGTEELMYAPLAVAEALRAAGPAAVRFSTTTRSPVQVRDVEGYAVRSGVRFVAHDRDADGYGEADRYAYNVVAPTPWRAIVVVLDRPSATAALDGPSGLLAALAPYATEVVPVVLPVAGTGPAPLHGPHFGSYAADEVTWLLKDLSHVALEGEREQREQAIQSGEAHYAESLPTEYRPDDAYRRLYGEQLATVADRVASAVVTVSELSRRVRGRDDLVIVSLARAGTPIGVLMRRWAAGHGWDWPHHAVSIVRDRGIDLTAMRWLADRYDPARVLVVDGWTGKGAIAREFAAAVAATNAALGLSPERGFRTDLAVLADPGECVELYGTRDDFLIPSACLNSTVSGLVSRTVLNADLIGPHDFHGAKFYAELAPEDVSGAYLDAVAGHFAAVEDAAVAEAGRLRESDRTPRWTGWAAAEKLQAEHGLPSVNLVKPGVGETTRVLLRRVPWRVVVAPEREADLRHVRLLAAERGVPVVEQPGLPYSCVGIIRPTEQDGS